VLEARRVVRHELTEGREELARQVVHRGVAQSSKSFVAAVFPAPERPVRTTTLCSAGGPSPAFPEPLVRVIAR
jgi:hypothetical protein